MSSIKAKDVLHRTKLMEWLPLINEAVTSSLSINEWCCRNNCSTNQMYYWMDVMRREGILDPENRPLVDLDTFDGSPLVDKQIGSSSNACFAELMPSSKSNAERPSYTVNPQNAYPDLMIQYSGFNLYIGNDVTETALGKVLRAMKNA